MDSLAEVAKKILNTLFTFFNYFVRIYECHSCCRALETLTIFNIIKNDLGKLLESGILNIYHEDFLKDLKII